MSGIDSIRLFGLNNLSIEQSLRTLEKELDAKITNRSAQTKPDTSYYPQFTERVRAQAASMAKNNELFFCLEVSIREAVSQRLIEQVGPSWWETCVPEEVKKNAENNQKKELSAGVTPRGGNMLSYTNFGELGQIIKGNWEIFKDLFSDVNAVGSVMFRLNTIRAPIAHCCLLSEDEEARLNLSLRDWFRLME